MLDPSALGEELQYSNSTFGFGLDFGMIYTFADLWFPPAVSMFNLPVSCRKLSQSIFSNQTKRLWNRVFRRCKIRCDRSCRSTNLMFGMSMTPRITRKFAMRVAVELHNINLEVGDQTGDLQMYLGKEGSRRS